MREVGYRVSNDVRIMGPLHSYCNLSIGNGTFIGTEFRCEGRGKVKIGNNCDIAPQVTILTGTHVVGTQERRAGEGITADVEIGNGCWVGSKSVIMPGVKIGNGCIVGACALVLNDMPDNSMALGIPARVTRIGDKYCRVDQRNETSI